MGLSFCVLGSGSSGNATLLAFERGSERRYALVDCGLSPRATALRLAPLGLTVEHLSDIFVSHFDADHFATGWLKVIRREGIAVHVHKTHRSRALRLGLTGRSLELFQDGFDFDDTAHVEPVLLAHDALGTVGFVLEHDGTRLGIATDLGRVPRQMLERFVGLDGLAIESNYDRRMQLASERPAPLKRRIMGGRGHLSNEEALRAAVAIGERSRLSHLVLLHVSRQCNDPAVIRRLYATRAPHLLDRLVITSQLVPTAVHDLGDASRARAWRSGEQLAMF